MTPPTVTQALRNAGVTGTATGGDPGAGTVDVETAVDVAVVVPAVVGATVVVVEVSERPSEASDSRVANIEPSTPSRPASARTPIRTSMGRDYRESRANPIVPMRSTLRSCVRCEPAPGGARGCSLRPCSQLCSQAPAVFEPSPVACRSGIGR